MKDKITEAEYTVVLTPEDGEPTEATFDGEVSELGTIEFLNNYLILADNTYQKGYAYVKGYDQFGTEINLAGLTVTCGVGDMTAYDSKTGKITLESDTDNAYMFIKQVPVFVSYQTGEGIISAQANLEVSTRAFVDEIEFGEIKKDGNARADGRLTITELASKKYYVELTTVKDQYGNDLSYKDLNKMVADNVMFVIPGANNGAYYTTNGFDEIDGTTILWLAPVADPKPGSMDLSITGAGGYTARTPVEVEDDPYIQTISITYPQLYAGHSKSANLAFTAIDQYGEEVNMWDVRPVVDPNDATGKTLKFSDKNHMTGKSTEVKLSGDIKYNAVIEDTVAKTWTVNIDASNAQAKNMAVVTTLTAGMVPYTKTITIGAQGNAINVLGKLSDNSKLELNPKANTKINFNQYLQFEDVNGEVMDRINSEMYPTFSSDDDIVLNETDSNVKMSDYTAFYWYLSESELPATSAYELDGTYAGTVAGTADRAHNPVIDADGVVTKADLARAQTSSKKYYVTVVGLANTKYYKLSEQDFRVTYIPAEDVKDAVLGNVVRKDTNAAGVNNFDPSATTNKYSAKISGPIYVNSDDGTEKAVELTVTNETGETYTLPLGDGYRVSTDSGLKINADGYTVSGKVSDVTSGTATLDVWLTYNDKKVATITVDYTNADPVPTSVKYEGTQSVANSKVASKVGSAFTFAPATRVETSENIAAAVTAKDGKIEITNANNLRDTYTAQVKDQYGNDWKKAEFYVNGQKVEWNGVALAADKEYVFKMIAGTVTKEITVVPGTNSTATVNQVVDNTGKAYEVKTPAELNIALGLAKADPKENTITIVESMNLFGLNTETLTSGDKLVIADNAVVYYDNGMAVDATATLTIDAGATFEIDGYLVDTAIAAVDDANSHLAVNLLGTMSGSGHYDAWNLTLGGNNAATPAQVTIKGTTLKLLKAPTVNTGVIISGNIEVANAVVANLTNAAVRGAQITLDTGASVMLPAAKALGTETTSVATTATIVNDGTSYEVSNSSAKEDQVTVANAGTGVITAQSSAGGTKISTPDGGTYTTTTTSAAVASTDTSIATLAAFKEAVAAGGSYTLTENIALDGDITLYNDLTLNMNGKTITTAANKELWVSNCTLTLVGSDTDSKITGGTQDITVMSTEAGGQGKLVVSDAVTVSKVGSYWFVQMTDKKPVVSVTSSGTVGTGTASAFTSFSIDNEGWSGVTPIEWSGKTWTTTSGSVDTQKTDVDHAMIRYRADFTSAS